MPTGSVTRDGTRRVILDAARAQLLAEGYAALTTRKVATQAGVPLSQVHYHFGSKGGMVLALLDDENRRRLERQAAMYGQDVPLWRRYEQACDFLDDDMASGYVRVLHEMIAAGWSQSDVADAVRAFLTGWYSLLTEVATQAAERFGGLGPFSPAELAALVGNAFLGSEEALLLGFEREEVPIRASLRRIGDVIRAAEEATGPAGPGGNGAGTTAERGDGAGGEA